MAYFWCILGGFVAGATTAELFGAGIIARVEKRIVTPLLTEFYRLHAKLDAVIKAAKS